MPAQVRQASSAAMPSASSADSNPSTATVRGPARAVNRSAVTLASVSWQYGRKEKIATATRISVNSKSPGSGLPRTKPVAALQVGSLACALLAVNNLRDVDEDARARKHTLAVSFGPAFGRAEIVGFTCGPFALGLLWIGIARPLAAALPFAALPLALGVLRIVLREPPGPRYNVALALAAALQLAFGALLSIGLVL